MWPFLLFLLCFYFGRGYADTSMDVITLYSVVPSGDSFSTSSDNFVSVSATPVGTASDGSATTYSEVVAYYGPATSALSSVVPTKTQEGTLVESASGYDLVLSDASAGFSAHCSLSGCVESEFTILETTISITRTSASTSFTSSSFSNGVTVPIFTLTAQLSSTSSVTTTSLPIAATPTLQHASSIHSKSVIGAAVGGAIGGVVFIALLTLTLWLINRRRQKRKGLREIRELPVSTGEFKPDTSSFTKSYGAQNPPTYTGVYPDLLNKPSTPQSISSKVADESIRAPSSSFVFPTAASTPPPPADPVALPRPEPLPPQVRNRPSRFIERLSINSTDLNVLMALARAEASRSKEKRKQDQNLEGAFSAPHSHPSSLPLRHFPSGPPSPHPPSPPRRSSGSPSPSSRRLSSPSPSRHHSPRPNPHSPTTSVHSASAIPRGRPDTGSDVDNDININQEDVESPVTFHSLPAASGFHVESPPRPRTPSSPLSVHDSRPS